MKLHIKTFDELSNSELYEILRTRAAVFLIELGMHCQDIDGTDRRALHCFYEKEGQILAYLRAFPDENDPKTAIVGRVLTTVRGKGLGKALLRAIEPSLRERLGCRCIVVHAQLQAAGFYEKLGFCAISDTYSEEGVPHISMEKCL